MIAIVSAVCQGYGRFRGRCGRMAGTTTLCSRCREIENSEMVTFFIDAPEKLEPLPPIVKNKKNWIRPFDRKRRRK